MTYYLDLLLKRRKVLEEIIQEKLLKLKDILPSIYGENWEVKINDIFTLKGSLQEMVVLVKGKEVDSLSKMDIYVLAKFVVALEELEEKLEGMAKEMYESILDMLPTEVYLKVAEKEERKGY